MHNFKVNNVWDIEVEPLETQTKKIDIFYISVITILTVFLIFFLVNKPTLEELRNKQLKEAKLLNTNINSLREIKKKELDNIDLYINKIKLCIDNNSNSWMLVACNLQK